MKKPVFGSQETVIRTLRNPVPVIFDLTNEAHVVPTDAEGNNGNYTGCGTTVVVYGGSVDETTSWNVSAGGLHGGHNLHSRGTLYRMAFTG